MSARVRGSLLFGCLMVTMLYAPSALRPASKGGPGTVPANPRARPASLVGLAFDSGVTTLPDLRPAPLLPRLGAVVAPGWNGPVRAGVAALGGVESDR